jgi:ethanolamine ammonia-lyase large subunit
MKKMAKVKKDGRPWMVVNDVAGFIGPEVFRNKEQLVRVGLEDIVMGKLHGLTIGMDICSTLHMDVSLEDLDWSVDQLMMANPGFLMALPTKNDPMLSYLTTAFQDHVRIREKFGYKIEDKMWEFFKKLGVLDEKGSPTKHFGDPAWVYYQYRRLKGDERSEAEIYVEARKKIEEVNHRGVPLAVGNGVHIWDLNPELGEEINSLYEDAKKNIWESFDSDFIKAIPYSLCLETKSINRTEYIVQPSSGEKLTSESVKKIKSLRNDRNKEVKIDVQVVVSDGLNANALMDVGHLDVYLDELKMYLKKRGFLMAPEVIVLINGRVRAGYRLGEFLFGSPTDSNPRSVIHLIGERPGTGHHNFSAYIAAPSGKNWNKKGFADHDIVKVVTGMSDTSLDPVIGAHETVDLLEEIILKKIGS